MPAETPPPELVVGCNTPEGLLILADWLDEHGGDGAEFREPMRDMAERPRSRGDDGNGWGIGYGDEVGDGNCYRFGYGWGWTYDSSDGFGYGCGFDNNEHYGTLAGDGGPDAPRELHSPEESQP